MSAAEREIRACVGLFKKELSKLVQQAIALEAKELRHAAALAERAEREQARQLKREQARLEREQAKALAAQAKANSKKLNGHASLSGPNGSHEAGFDESSAENGQQFTFKLDVAGAAAELEELGLTNGIRRKGNGGSSSARRKRPSNSLISNAITEHVDASDRVSDEPMPPAKPEPLFVHKRSRDGEIKTLTRVASDNPA